MSAGGDRTMLRQRREQVRDLPLLVEVGRLELTRGQRAGGRSRPGRVRELEQPAPKNAKCCVPDLILQPEIVIFMAAGRLVVGSGRRERGLAAGVATMTSATGARDRRQDGRSGPRTGAGPRCRSTRSPLVEPDVGRAR